MSVSGHHGYMPHIDSTPTQAIPIVTLVGAADAATALEVDPKTVRRWANTGQLPAVGKLSGRRGAYIFNAADVEAKAAARREASK